MTIWKAVLDTGKMDQTILMPRGSTFLYAREQGMKLCVWYKVPHEDAPKHPCQILVMRTGQATEVPMALLTRLGCGVFHDGAFVLHVFSVMPGYLG